MKRILAGKNPIPRLAALLIAASMLFAGCQKQNEQGAPPPRPTPEVATVTITPRQVELTTELPGRTSAFRIAEIRPQINGLILERIFEEGADVEKGQLLYRIDPVPLQVAFDSAKASLGKARANLPAIQSRAERYHDLLADKAVSRQDYDDAAAAVEQVKAEIEYWKAQVQAARINLDYTRVVAPFDGRIGRSHVREGTLVTAYQPQSLATLQQIDPLYVDVVQSSAELLRLRRRIEAGRLRPDGQDHNQVDILLEDGTPYDLPGTLQFADVTVDPATGSYSLRIVVPNPENVLLPGMYVRAVIQEGIAEKAILVTQQGISRNTKGEPVALIVDETGKVQQRLLVLDRAMGNQWLVASGLTPGDRVIVEGMLNIRPGMAVNAVDLQEGKHSATVPQTGGTAAAPKQ
jgi:membrane fusion protein, multidrug efflux system